MQRCPRILTVVAAVACTSASLAEPAQRPAGSPALQFTVGGLDVFDGPHPLAIGLEYRWPPLGRWSLVPGAGLLTGSDGSRYVYADLSRSFVYGRGWYATVAFGAGYFHDGSVVQLGHELEFRSGLEIGRWLDRRRRLALAFDHLSNAGLSDHNPGTDILTLRLSTAIGGADQPAVATSPVPPPGAAADEASWRSSSRRISSPASAR